MLDEQHTDGNMNNHTNNRNDDVVMVEPERSKTTSNDFDDTVRFDGQ